MILIDCPSCEAPITADAPVPGSLRCDDCAVAWDVTDAAPMPSDVRLAA
ncbi:MAG: hypothetical protein HY264_06560 [Chloroflexi bacterium]|nr:hypothetical protein [Chloroflexota bacterium]